VKEFKKEFYKFLKMLKKGENFAFTRFSDGELYMMQNRKVVIEEDKVFLRERTHSGYWGPEELKSFNPETDQFYREKLIECFKHEQKKYFKGICFPEDIGKKDYEWQWSLLGSKEKIEFITWSNLLINGNYPDFIEKMVPEFRGKKIIYVCNKLANISNLPFNIIKDFRVGQNCHVNNYNLITVMDKWMSDHKVSDHIFLFSVASLSNYLIYNLYKKFPNNTYLDIGSTLNPLLNLNGWKGSRHYLREYWMNETPLYTKMIGKWE
jgi:hypothetical protein